jgi:hypothetical protein
MLLKFFYTLRKIGVPVTPKEHLVLLEAMSKNLVFANVEEFYQLARLCLVKDEKYYDKFDRAFGVHFEELESLDDYIEALIPEEWLRQDFMKSLSEEEKAAIESLGGLEELIEAFKKRLEEQKERHEGGNKWVGTGGTSPFGHGGFHPEGIRVGGQGGQRKAVKVWDQRQYRNYDDDVQLGTRNIKVALKRLRKFARTGAADQLDIDDTIRKTANNAGYLDITMVPEKHNAVKVLLFLDVGGSMDSYVRTVEELFSAAKTEFKHLEYFYFHNFIYDHVWKNNLRRAEQSQPLSEVLNKYGSDYKVIFVGDAAMAPYEVVSPGGSVEYWNQESGEAWMRRVKAAFPKLVWLNPTPEKYWVHTQSISMIRELVEDDMYPLTIDGLARAMQSLVK